MIDPIPALITWLSTRDPIKALVGNYPNHRIYGEELDPVAVDLMPSKAIVIRSAGGGGIGDRGPVKLVNNRYDFFCYGETVYDASLVQTAVHEEMKTNLIRVVSMGVLLHGAERSGGPVPLKDPEGNWPLKLETWLVMASTTSVS